MSTNTLREIVLHGHLAEQFGPSHHLDVSSAAEAIRALIFTRPGFRDAMRQGHYQVYRGDTLTGMSLTEDMFSMGLGSAPLHVLPAIEGSKGNGASKIIMGVVIVALAVVTYGAGAYAGAGAAAGEGAAAGATATTSAGFFGTTAFAGISYGQIAGIGASLLLGGISQLLTPSQKTNAGNTPAQNPSYVFSGPGNTDVEGSCVPLPYGDVLVGSVQIAASLTTMDISATGGAASSSTSGAAANLNFPPIYETSP